MLKAWIQDQVHQYKDKKYYCFASRQAERGNGYGQFLLAQMYEMGNAAVKQNRVTAYVLYYAAYQQGTKEAQYYLESLEAKLLMEEWQEAQDIIRNHVDKP